MRISLRMTAAAVAFGFIFGVVTTASAQGTSGGLGNRPQGGANQGGQGGLGQGGVAPRNTAPAAAPASAAGSSGPSVVVIDIGEVFKQHAQFNSQLNSLKEEIKGLDGYYQGEQKKIAQKRDQMQTFNAGTPEYKRAEEEMARMASELQVEMALKQKGIAEQEAKIYFNTYNEIYNQVQEFAERYGISLVLRHNNVAMDPQKRDTVLQGVNRAIVYQRQLDITDEIIKRVNSAQARRTTPAAAPAGAGRATPR